MLDLVPCSSCFKGKPKCTPRILGPPLFHRPFESEIWRSASECACGCCLILHKCLCLSMSMFVSIQTLPHLSVIWLNVSKDPMYGGNGVNFCIVRIFPRCLKIHASEHGEAYQDRVGPICSLLPRWMSECYCCGSRVGEETQAPPFQRRCPS